MSLVDVALLSRVGALGELTLTLGGSGEAASSSFAIRTTVREGLGARSIEILFRDAGRAHLDDLLRTEVGSSEVPPRLAVPWALDAWKVLPDADVATADALLRDATFGADPVLDEPPISLGRFDSAGSTGRFDSPGPPVRLDSVPRDENELRALLAESPFPSGARLSAREVELLELTLPSIREGASPARARTSAETFARTASLKIEGTPIEARARRITAAAARALGWSGRAARAAHVERWHSLPLDGHPIVISMLVETALEGPVALPVPAAVRATVRETLAAPFSAGGTRRDLLVIELGASIAATLEVALAHTDYREIIPPRYVVLEIARAAAQAAIAAGKIEPTRAAASLRTSLASVLSDAVAARVVDLATRSAEKLAESATRPPMRLWATGPLDEPITPSSYFTHGPPRF